MVHGTNSDRGYPPFLRDFFLNDCRPTRYVDSADSVNCPFWALFARLDLRLGRPAQALVCARSTAPARAVGGRSDEFGRRDVGWRVPRNRPARMGGSRITISSRAKSCPAGPKERLKRRFDMLLGGANPHFSPTPHVPGQCATASKKQCRGQLSSTACLAASSGTRR